MNQIKKVYIVTSFVMIIVTGLLYLIIPESQGRTADGFIFIILLVNSYLYLLIHTDFNKQ